jgi:hypothetical protein
MRVETISFVVVVLLACTIVMRWLWNYLAEQFTILPKLTYRRAIAASLLWGVVMALILTMVAAARELLTPGAWKKQGVLYKVAPATSPELPPVRPETSQLELRMEHLKKLSAALASFAAKHDGKYPASETTDGIDSSLWELPGASGMRYVYVPGLKVDESRILAYEPNLYGDERMVLRANREIAILSTNDLHKQLSSKSP